MQSREDVIPLLSDAAFDDASCDRISNTSEHGSKIDVSSALQRHVQFENGEHLDSLASGHSSRPCPDEDGWSHHDIICIFVVAFDSRTGNIVEWSMPKEMDLDGIEFKAMASGLHNIIQDFIYFKKSRMYGLSCFKNMAVDSDIERGARMKSVGILTSSYQYLHRYKPFLASQVGLLLETPGQYSPLEKFYNENRGILPNRNELPFLLELHARNQYKMAYPDGCFVQFIQTFGEMVFLIWKLVLLRKRILFFSTPPIGIACHYVLCSSSLIPHVPGIPQLNTNILFYVNIADIEELEATDCYLACTTEKILEAKRHLYDVYIENWDIRTTSPKLKDVLKLTAADRLNYSKLLERAFQLPNSDSEGENNDSRIQDFFISLNNSLFRMLVRVSTTEEKQLTNDIIKEIGLDPFGDRCFLSNLIEMYSLGVTLPPENLCCSLSV